MPVEFSRSGVIRSACWASVALALLAVITLGFATNGFATLIPPAGLPPAGLACTASDGKIDGRGSIAQYWLHKAFAEAYVRDYCGSVEQVKEDPSGHTMVAYDYPASTEFLFDRSVAAPDGLQAAGCRTDDFAGSDLPYTEAELRELDELVRVNGCELGFTTPYQPHERSDGFPAKLMSIPLGGYSSVIVANLPAGACGGSAPKELSFTATEVSRIFGGDAHNWNDSELVANNPSLRNCAFGIERAVTESDPGGAQAVFKQYLTRAENERVGATCQPATKWAALETSEKWPGWEPEPGCAGLVSSHEANTVKLVFEHTGRVGVAALAEVVHRAPGLVVPKVRNATNTSYQPANVGTVANCDLRSLPGGLPGVNAEEAVGLSLLDNWSVDNSASQTEGGNEKPDHGNATDLGAKYPICGLAFALVFTHDEGASPHAAIAQLSADQRRTLYSYLTLMLSSAGQDILSENDYTPLPLLWLRTLREGFQANF